jgi:thioredoxin 1
LRHWNPRCSRYDVARLSKIVLIAVSLIFLALLGVGRLKKPPESEIDAALRMARQRRHFLMVEFGADWCGDCRALAANLDSPELREYFKRHFDLLRVDVGQFDRNVDMAKSVGVDINQGIPTAVFFAPDGKRIGATNQGELASSSLLGPDQIQTFLRAIVEQYCVTKPK